MIGNIIQIIQHGVIKSIIGRFKTINKNEVLSNINIGKGIDLLKGRAYLVNEEINSGKLKDDNIEYCKNFWVNLFNASYDIFESMGIVPDSNTFNLSCIEYTKARLKYVNKL